MTDPIEKEPLGNIHPAIPGRVRANEMAPRRLRTWTAGFAIVAIVYLMWSWGSGGTQLIDLSAKARGRADCDRQRERLDGTNAKTVEGKELVPLEAHIMSKCPDAKDCLKMLVLPTMQQVVDKVNFTLSFIGTPTDNDGVACKHGPPECLGNIVELCAAYLYPDPKTYLGFTMCLTRDYQDIPAQSLLEDCALEHGIDFRKLNECVEEDNGGKGVGLLRDSVRRSTEAGVTKSCTIRLDEEIYCIRDGGEWKDCPGGPGVNDLVVAIEKKYRS